MMKKGLAILFITAGLLIFAPIKGFSFSDLIQTNDNVAYEKALEDALGGVFHNLTADFTAAYKTFAGDIALAAVGVGQFSIEKVDNFNDTVESKMKTFKLSCQAAADTAMSSYYAFLKEQDRFALDGKDAVAQDILEAIRIIREDFEDKVGFYKIVMLSGGTMGDLAKQLSAEVNLFNAEAEAEFLKKQEAATKIVTLDAWEKFVVYLDHFGPTFGNQLLEDLGKTVGAVLESQLGKLGEGVSKFLGELTVALSDYAKEKASELLEKMGKSLTPSIEKMLEKIMPAIEPMLKLVGKKLENVSLELLDSMVKETLRTVFKPKHEFKDVSVRTNMALCEDEKAFIKIRMEKASAVLKEKFGIQVPLKIGMMSSGGGLRAMFGYLGFSIAAEEANIWDASLYSVGLSGSTWNVMPYSYAHALNGTSLKQYRDFLIYSDKFLKPFPDFSGSELGSVGSWLVKEYAYELPFSSTDLTGLLFAHGCVMDRQAKIKISEMIDGIKTATIPLPLCAAVYYESNVRTKNSGGGVSPDDKDKTVVSDEELDKIIDEVKDEYSDSYISNEQLGLLLEDVAQEEGSKSTALVLYGSNIESTETSIEEVDSPAFSLGKLGGADVDDLEQKLKDALAASAKDAEKYTKQTEYGWIEWSPFEVGSVGLGGFIPTWAWGTSFNNGKPVDGFKGAVPEYPLYTLMGTWGSAYAVTANDVIDRVPEKLPSQSFDFLGTDVKLPVGDWISTYFDTMGVESSEARLLAPTYFNFSQGLSGSSIKDSEKIELVDAGMDSNMPFPLLMNRDGRAMDAIFLFHSDAGTTTIFETIVMYFKRKGIAYPAAFDSVTEESLTSKEMTVFNDPREDDYDKGLPVFFYFPFLTCPDHAKDTFNFAFTGEQVSETVNAASDMFASQVAEITQVLQSLARKKGDSFVELLDDAGSKNKAQQLTGAIAAEGAASAAEVESEEGAVENSTSAVDISDQDEMFNQLISTGEVTISTPVSAPEESGLEEKLVTDFSVGSSVYQLISTLKAVQADLAVA